MTLTPLKQMGDRLGFLTSTGVDRCQYSKTATRPSCLVGEFPDAACAACPTFNVHCEAVTTRHGATSMNCLVRIPISGFLSKCLEPYRPSLACGRSRTARMGNSRSRGTFGCHDNDDSSRSSDSLGAAGRGPLSIEVESPPNLFAMGRAGTTPQANPHHDRVSDRLLSVLGRPRLTNVSGRFI
jgi:hypothetical protein